MGIWGYGDMGIYLATHNKSVLPPAARRPTEWPAANRGVLIRQVKLDAS